MGSLNPNTLKVAGVVTFYMSAALVQQGRPHSSTPVTSVVPLQPAYHRGRIATRLRRVLKEHSNSKIGPSSCEEATTGRLCQYHRTGIQYTMFARSRGVVLPGAYRYPSYTARVLERLKCALQIARGMQLPLTIFISSLNTHSTPSTRVIAAAAIVTCGFFVGIAPNSSIPITASPSLLSLFYGLLSSLFIAVHAVLIKSSLPHCDNSTIQLAWWTNAGSAILILPFILLNGETGVILEMVKRGDKELNVFAWGSLVTGVFGFLLCVAGLLSIKVTSPITHMFSSVRMHPWIFENLFLTHFG
ncbi:hypothetical protein PM082_003249 [Marasmius tenuissimus]|nr:hypothetical protein PM082_003249 [Marasmius tenuissimus]